MAIIAAVPFAVDALLLFSCQQRVSLTCAAAKYQQRGILWSAAGKILCIGFSLVVSLITNVSFTCRHVAHVAIDIPTFFV